MGAKKAAVLDAEKPQEDKGLVTVQLFNCEVRLGGDIMHTLWLNSITNGEIRILRAIHGDTSVVNISPAGEKEVNEKEVLFDLAVRYSKDIDPTAGVRLVEKVFGVSLDGFAEWNDARIEAMEDRRLALQAESQNESARIERARVAAEARVRAELAEEKG